ncbi:MAG: hypothetical protein Q9181_006618 [Wetmoreana brouardii]
MTEETQSPVRGWLTQSEPSLTRCRMKPTGQQKGPTQKGRSPQTLQRKYKDGKKLRKKNSQGIFEYDVTVVSADYDKVKHSWMYKLKDYKSVLIEGTTRERDLG